MAAKIAANTYRRFTPLIRSPDHPYPHFLTASGDPVLSMCLNDYLAYSQSEEAREAAATELRDSGVGTGGSRNIGGTRSVHSRLEAAIGDLHQSEDALLYASGNAANTDLIACLARALGEAIFLSDSENHASIIEPLRALPRERRLVFAHNDVAALDRAYARAAPDTLPILVVESLYSMSGTWAPLAKLADWIEEREGVFIVNEVHALGVRGDAGAGRLAELALATRAHAVTGSFSKGFGAAGGYVAGRGHVVDLCRQTGANAIFTTSMPEYVAAAALANLMKRRGDAKSAAALSARIALLRGSLGDRGVHHGGDIDSHIVAVPIGDETRCREISAALLTRGFYVTPICHPTVPAAAAQLRVTVTPLHAEQAIAAFATALADCLSA